MRNYEIMFIVNPNAPEDEIDKINAQIEGIVTAGGGKVEKIEKMGKRRLAYEVDKHREGFYVLFVIAANGDIIKECERRLRVMDAVIKYLTVRTDEEIRRLDKIKATGRSALRAAAPAPKRCRPAQSAEEAMQ